jgi:hypothetical protein
MDTYRFSTFTLVAIHPLENHRTIELEAWQPDFCYKISRFHCHYNWKDLQRLSMHLNAAHDL